MATDKQIKAAKQNIKKAQKKRQSMSSREHARSQPEGRTRRKPGSTGQGDYYHIEVRPKTGFVSFRTQDVGERGHVQRVAGRRSSGSWATVKWLIGKSDAHMENGRLVADTAGAREVISRLGSAPVHTSGDRFTVRDRLNIP